MIKATCKMLMEHIYIKFKKIFIIYFIIYIIYFYYIFYNIFKI
jgi:hypothetical protein